jgi:hypothetical protein
MYRNISTDRAIRIGLFAARDADGSIWETGWTVSMLWKYRMKRNPNLPNPTNFDCS